MHALEEYIWIVLRELWFLFLVLDNHNNRQQQTKTRKLNFCLVFIVGVGGRTFSLRSCFYNTSIALSFNAAKPNVSVSQQLRKYSTAWLFYSGYRRVGAEDVRVPGSYSQQRLWQVPSDQARWVPLRVHSQQAAAQNGIFRRPYSTFLAF